jgi:cardiolipin synthase
MHGFWVAFFFIAEFAVKSTLVLIILSRRRTRHPNTVAWVVLILAVPVVGLLAFLLAGEPRLGAARVRRHREIHLRKGPFERLPRHSAGGYREEQVWASLPPEYVQLARLGETVARNPPRPGNLLELIGNAETFVQKLVADIDGARSYCHLEFYIMLPDSTGIRVGEALKRAQARGVDTRLLLDSVGSRTFLRSSLRKNIEKGGVRVVECLPARLIRALFSRLDLRNHRKIAIIDGTVGYTGSQNIADEHFAPKKRFAPWVDTMVRIQGPILCDLQELFDEDWALDHPVVDETPRTLHLEPRPSGVIAQVIATGPHSFNAALRQLIPAAFHTAKEELILTTPYFVPDETTIGALETAARRGVETTLVVPRRNDSPLVATASRSHYDILLDAGVRIREFEGGLLHSKTMTVDRNLSVVSTANLDRRSFELNFEVSLVIFDTDFSSHLRLLQKSYLDRSVAIVAEDWERRPWLRRVASNAAGALSAVL